VLKSGRDYCFAESALVALHRKIGVVAQIVADDRRTGEAFCCAVTLGGLAVCHQPLKVTPYCAVY